MGRKRARWLLSLLVASSSALVAAVPVRADQPPDHHGRVTVENVWVTPANEAEQAILRLRILNETPSLKFSLSPMAGRTSRTTPSITSTTGRLDGRKLSDEIVIVSGGSAGVGRAAVRRFAEAGAKIVITARRAAALDEAAGDRRNIFATVADAVSPEDAVRSA